MRRTLAPVLVLALLSPFLAEFLLGDQYLMPGQGAIAQLSMFITLGLWYGAGAVLIREITRRVARGWPTILLLGLAFGLLEEGLLTQSLFNPHYLGFDLISYGYLGWLGTGVPWAIFVLTLHVVWSIATPIALVEGIWPGREPWLGRIGLAVTTMVLVLGALAIFAVSWATSGFLASPGQLIGSALLAVIVAGAALRLPRVDAPRPAGPVLPAALLATLLASAYQVLHHYGREAFPAWLTTVLSVALLAGTIAAAIGWRLDVLGLAIGPVIAYAWVGLANATAHGVPAMVEQVVITAVALTVTGLALRRRDRAGIRPSGSGADAAASAASR